MYCSSCGTEANQTADFCARCGTKLRQPPGAVNAAHTVRTTSRFAPFLVPAWVLLILSSLGAMLLIGVVVDGSTVEPIRDAARGAALLWTAAFGLRAILRKASTGNYLLAAIGPFFLGVATPLGLILMLAALTTSWMFRKHAEQFSAIASPSGVA
jgi:hypothetical protein